MKYSLGKCKYFAGICMGLDTILGLTEPKVIGTCGRPDLRKHFHKSTIDVYKDSLCGSFHSGTKGSFPCDRRWKSTENK